MSHVRVNGRIQDLAESEKQNKVVPGCGETEQRDQGVSRPNQLAIVRVGAPSQQKERRRNNGEY